MANAAQTAQTASVSETGVLAVTFANAVTLGTYGAKNVLSMAHAKLATTAGSMPKDLSLELGSMGVTVRWTDPQKQGHRTFIPMANVTQVELGE